MNFPYWLLYFIIVANWWKISQGFGFNDALSGVYDINAPQKNDDNYFHLNQNKVYDKSEISKINDWAITSEDVDNQSRNAKVRKMYRTGKHQRGDCSSLELAANNKKKLYIILNKGRTHYMPLNANEKTRISHFPLNVNGEVVNLPEMHVLQKTGLINNIPNSNDHRYNADNLFNGQRPDFVGRNHNLNQLESNNFENKYKDEENNISNFEKRGCKHHEFVQQRPIQMDTTSRESIKNSGNNNKVIFKNTAITHQNNYHIEYNHPKVLLNDESKQQQNGDRRESKDQQNFRNEEPDTILGSPALPNRQSNEVVGTSRVNEMSADPEMNTMTHKSIIDVNEININENFENKQQNVEKIDDFNAQKALDATTTKSNTQTVTFDDKSIIPNTSNVPPTYGTLTTLPGESPIISIKINPLLTVPNEARNDNIKQLNALEDIPQPNPTETDSNDTTATLEKTIETKEGNNNVMTSTVETLISTANSVLNDSTSDLEPSEDRLYAYITKFDRKSGKQLPQKANLTFGKLEGKYLDPLAYETMQMEPYLGTDQKNSKHNETHSSKLKRYAPMRPLFLGHTVSKDFQKQETNPTDKSIAKVTDKPIVCFINDNLARAIISKGAQNPQQLVNNNRLPSADNNLRIGNNGDNFVGSPQQNSLNDFFNIFRKPTTQRVPPLVGSNLIALNKKDICGDENGKDQILGSSLQNGNDRRPLNNLQGTQRFGMDNNGYISQDISNGLSLKDNNYINCDDDVDNNEDDQMVGIPQNTNQFTDRGGNVTPARPETLSQIC